MELQDQVMTEFAASKVGCRIRCSAGAHWYGASVVPVMLAHANNAHEAHIVNLPNGTTLDWMPGRPSDAHAGECARLTALRQAKTPLTQAWCA